MLANKEKPRYIILAPSHPIPISNGSHLDTLGITETLTNFGAEVLILSFSKVISLDYFKSSTIYSIPRSRKLWRLIFGLLPWQAISRELDSRQIAMALDFKADHIICVQEYSYVSLRQIESKLNYSPNIILRRANDEIQFIRAARTGTTILRKIYLIFEEVRLRILENKWNQRLGLELWDIAPDFDSPSHQIKKLTGPVFPNLPYDLSERDTTSEKTIIYIGNLSLGHCIEGLKWFISNCWLSIAKQEPNSKLVFAGLNPTRELLELAKRNNVKIISNPVETDDLLMNSSVFINPIFQGSGVNMKLCRPAQFEIPIVSTDFGARGYLGKLNSLKIASEPVEFTELILELLRNQELHTLVGKRLKDEIDVFLGNNQQNEIHKILFERHHEG